MNSRTIKTIGYWASTGIVAALFLLGGVADAAHPPDVVAALGHLGYPAYFAVLLGVWKILGAIAIVAPRFPRLKEWAYAGIFFDLTSAAISSRASGDSTFNVVAPLALVLVVVASWALRPASRKLAAAAAQSPKAVSYNVTAEAAA
jgi:uncharacterized membrane protein YphA (DoxX/SURF4 family)